MTESKKKEKLKKEENQGDIVIIEKSLGELSPGKPMF